MGVKSSILLEPHTESINIRWFVTNLMSIMFEILGSVYSICGNYSFELRSGSDTSYRMPISQNFHFVPVQSWLSTLFHRYDRAAKVYQKQGKSAHHLTITSSGIKFCLNMKLEELLWPKKMKNLVIKKYWYDLMNLLLLNTVSN